MNGGCEHTKLHASGADGLLLLVVNKKASCAFCRCHTLTWSCTILRWYLRAVKTAVQTVKNVTTVKKMQLKLNLQLQRPAELLETRRRSKIRSDGGRSTLLSCCCCCCRCCFCLWKNRRRGVLRVSVAASSLSQHDSFFLVPAIRLEEVDAAANMGVVVS